MNGRELADVGEPLTAAEIDELCMKLNTSPLSEGDCTFSYIILGGHLVIGVTIAIGPFPDFETAQAHLDATRNRDDDLARSLEDLNGHLPAGPGTVEEMSHQTNLSARKFRTMVADCRSDLLKGAR